MERIPEKNSEMNAPQFRLRTSDGRYLAFHRGTPVFVTSRDSAACWDRRETAEVIAGELARHCWCALAVDEPEAVTA